MPHTPAQISSFTTLACLLEAGAPKPGNVAPGQPFRDMSYEDFVASAVAAGPELGLAGTRPLGETIFEAVRATHQWTPANTNLGIILLLAPLARAASLPEKPGTVLRDRLREVLRTTTIQDARDSYLAILLAAPGGLGSEADQDLAQSPTITLVETMALAAHRDSVASEYVTEFALTFETAVPVLRNARADGLSWPDAVVETFLTLLAERPDTLIARKLGLAVARGVSHQADRVRQAGGVRCDIGRAALATFDADLRDTQNSQNPGTTADLTAAALFALLVEDGWVPDRMRSDRAE